jgi:hypothetical protein
MSCILGKFITRPQRIIEGAWIQGNEWHDVYDTNTWMNSRVLVNVQGGNRLASKNPSRLSAVERKNTAVMIGVTVQVKQIDP